jgi:hypothetical protein
MTVVRRGDFMRTISLQKFHRWSARALGAEGSMEPLILANREREFLLLPLSAENRAAMLDLAEGLIAVLALRQEQARAVEVGLDKLTSSEIDSEIKAARKAIKRRKCTI